MTKKQRLLSRDYFSLSPIEAVNNQFLFFQKLKQKHEPTNNLNSPKRALTGIENEIYSNGSEYISFIEKHRAEKRRQTMSNKPYGVKFWLSKPKADVLKSALDNVGINFTENIDSFTIDKEESEVSELMSTALLASINATEYGENFTASQTEMQSKIKTSIKKIQDSIVNAESGKISMERLAANVALLRNVQGGLTKAVKSAVERHKTFLIESFKKQQELMDIS